MSSQFGFIDIILLAMFAGFIILRLRNILGRKTGHQGKSMSRHFPRGMEVLHDIEKNEAIRSGNVDEEVKKNFLKGADIAYEQIITSFAKGDKKSLKLTYDIVLKEEMDSNKFVLEISNCSGVNEASIVAAQNDIDY